MIAKTDNDIAGLRTAGRMLGEILRETARRVAPGVAASALDLFAEGEIRKRGAVPAFLNYQPEGAAYPYPAVLCVCVNDEVVHGLPLETKVFKEGDTVMLDLGLSYQGYFADAAVTVCAGEGDQKSHTHIDATREALADTIKVAKVGNRIGDISAAIEAVAKKHGLGVVEELGGHSLGRVPHEPPFVANAGTPGTGEILVEGQVLAVEPIFTQGSGDVVLGEDEWTYRTADGSRSAEFEHTILITKNGAEILTA